MLRRLAITAFVVVLASFAHGDSTLPNVVIIFLDDSAYADFEPFGNPPYPTPNVKQLATEGRSFDRFYVPQAVCSASRAALMTGCFPGRTGMVGAHGPRKRGLEPAFATLAEVLKPRGYTTGVFGKWHLGDEPDTRPPARGFDESAGLMYSNDMWRFHPEQPERYPELQYWENGAITIADVSPDQQKCLTKWATEHAVDFIARHNSEPFLLYVPHSMPHVPIFCSDAFEGRSGAGLYGDVIMEIDWSVGEITAALREYGVEDNTIVFFISSDNGPWTSYGNHAGISLFREAKGTSFDGGVRNTCIARFPGRIESDSRSDAVLFSTDIFPTVATLAGAELPANEIDGKDAWDILVGNDGAATQHAYFPFSIGQTFTGIMSGDGKWKLHVPHTYRVVEVVGNDGAPGRYTRGSIGYALYDMESDPMESQNVINAHAGIANRLRALARAHRREFYEER